MTARQISKEIELKFRRLATQMLPKANYSSALVINASDGLVCEYLNYLGVPNIFGVESNEALRLLVQQKLPNVSPYERLSQLKAQHFDLIIVQDKVDFLDDATENKIFEKIAKDCSYIIADLFTYDSMTESIFKVFKLSPTEKMSMPTTKKLIDQFPGHLARKVDQAPTHFKNVVRTIWHFRKRLPYAVVLAQRPWSGKTTFARHVFSDLTHIELDKGLVKINNNELEASDAVKNILQAPNCLSMGGKKLYHTLSENNCYIDFVKAVTASIDKGSDKGIIVDGYVPLEQTDNLHQFLADTGYYVVEISLSNAMKPDADYSIQQVQDFYDALYKGANNQ